MLSTSCWVVDMTTLEMLDTCADWCWSVAEKRKIAAILSWLGMKWREEFFQMCIKMQTSFQSSLDNGVFVDLSEAGEVDETRRMCWWLKVLHEIASKHVFCQQRWKFEVDRRVSWISFEHNLSRSLTRWDKFWKIVSIACKLLFLTSYHANHSRWWACWVGWKMSWAVQIESSWAFELSSIAMILSRAAKFCHSVDCRPSLKYWNSLECLSASC